MTTEATRKPLARVAAEGRAHNMVVKPVRWPEGLWERFEALAVERRVSVSEVVREAGITGLSMMEARAAVRAHKGNTA